MIDNLIRGAHQFLISTASWKRWETKSTTGNGATQAGLTSTCHLSPLVFVAPKPLLRELIVTQQMQLVRQLVPWRRRPRCGHSHAWFGSRSFGVCHLGISEEPCVKSKLTMSPWKGRGKSLIHVQAIWTYFSEEYSYSKSLYITLSLKLGIVVFLFSFLLFTLSKQSWYPCLIGILLSNKASQALHHPFYSPGPARSTYWATNRNEWYKGC